MILSPIYLVVNIFFIHEIFKWLNSLCNITNANKTVFRIIKITLGILCGFATIAIFIAFLIPAGLSMDEYPTIYKLRRVLKTIANYHLGVFIYEGIAFLVILVCRLLERIHWIRQGLSKEERQSRLYNKRRCIIGLLNFGFIIFVTIYGTHVAQDIQITPYEISIDKSVPDMNSMNIVLVSDLHMGYNIGIDQISQMVTKINSQNPDLVVIAGDIFDNEYEALEDPVALSRLISEINSKYGVYGVWGNHDVEERILGGFTFSNDSEVKKYSDEMMEFIENSGITMLCEESVMINDEIYLYGRPDYSRPGNKTNSRLSAEDIVKDMDSSMPIIVIDHQPREYDKLAKAGVDLDLGGHTHDGQFFPMTLTSRYFTWENSAGYIKKGDMHCIVTSGVGLFGPNIRLGSIAEIASIKVNFSQGQ